MAYLDSRLSHSPGQRRDNSVMSISSLIDSRNGEAYSRTAGGHPRPASMAGCGMGASTHGPSRSPAMPPTAMSPTLRRFSPPDMTKEEDEDEMDGQLITPTAVDWRGNPLASKSSSRDPRPSYTEEQKFFIMWARIVQEKGWADIEDQFTRVFNQRTKGGLTSVYYRIRKNWKLKEVLSNDPGSSDADRQAVAKRAANFSRGFLREIGYAMSAQY